MIDQHRLQQEQALPTAVRGSLIRFHNVSVAYEEHQAPVLQNVSFDIAQGESVLFLGPSGCGKSTLAMLCGKLIPSSVEGVVTGDVEYHPSLSTPGGVGYVFQDPDAQFCMVHVDDEVAFGLENAGVQRAEMWHRICGALSEVQLDVPPDAEHAKFSGGMKQKLAVASALAMHPALLIFDEPTANLDPRSSRVVFEQIAALHAEQHTLIVIEHKFDPLLPHMDKVVLFDRNGTVRRVGTPIDVLSTEWDWMVDAGVVPAWKARPEWLERGNDAAQLRDYVGGPTSVTQRRSKLEDVNKPSAVKISGLSLHYGDKRIWNNLNLEIPTGAFVALVGPNGAGKSSLLHVMAGLQKPSSGEICLLGHPLKRLKPGERQRILSLCFQNPEYQFIYERVLDELANGPVQGEAPAQITALLQGFGLTGLEDHSPFALSQGQKRRLSVASMVREEHDLYLLDEPTFGQDARTQWSIMERIKDLHESGKTVIMTTHDMDLVKRYASHVMVLCDGDVTYFGTPQELFDQPDLLRRAHLLADLEELHGIPPVAVSEGNATALPNLDPSRLGPSHGIRKQKGLAKYLNPPLLFVSVLLTVIAGIAARELPQTVAIFLWSIALLFMIPRLNPWQVLKRLSPFLGFYVLYLWSFTAFTAVPPGTKTIHFLWYDLSIVGLMTGFILAFRMLAAVTMGILLVSSTEITALIVGLCQNFRLAPKFAYGILAGLRLAPLFHNEWTKLRNARQLRGKDARYPWLRPVTYALPLLTQAIRMSERVATAMEARSFVGKAASHASGRTFYRDIRIHWWDWVIGLLLPVGALVLIFVLK